ncbi:restriction endonuclease subunit S [Campylobacter hyointestinalis]|uniref:restriction endonuclease subunit S n=1 Tax=Campylobacter hyointestinalis TaxID=198 RepID=UPI00215BD27E|nr:restriction endonuclease subunit S [Campylobacter hyointestinalis]
MFEKLNLGFKKSKFEKDKDVSKIKNIEFQIPLVNAKDGDNGIMYYGKKQDFDTATMTIDIVNDGAVSTGNVYPQPQETGVLYNAYLIKSKFDISKNLLFFFATTIQKSIKLKFSYELKASWERVKNENIKLPITQNGEIDFNFMESFIAELEAERVRELEAYLKAADLADTTLSADEQNALNTLNSKIWQEFKFKDIFNNIKQGRRVKKDDQIDGDIPFIMSGITNTGFVKNISNPIEIYPKNSITIDIFGNTFYRNYVYGAGDDTGIYWNDIKDYSKLVMLFFATSMAKSVYGKFDFGKKLRSSQSLDFTMKLPITTNGEIDFEFMESFISGVQKISIKGVIELKDKIIEQTKKAI